MCTEIAVCDHAVHTGNVQNCSLGKPKVDKNLATDEQQ